MACEMGDRLVKGGSCDGSFAGGFPQVDGAVSRSGRLGVYGEDFGGNVGVSLQRRQDTRVDGAALLFQLAFIGRVAHQCVFEEIGCLGRQAAAVDQFGSIRPSSAASVRLRAEGRSAPAGHG